MLGTAIGLILTALNVPRAGGKRMRSVVILHLSDRAEVYTASEGIMVDSNDQFLPEYGVRVFLVEDNPEHAFIAVTVIRQLLGEASEVIVAENADEAVGLISQFTDQDRPDLMLVDLRLPENGGFSVLSAARQHEPCANVPTFVITSSLYDKDIAQSYELGASAVLCKPLSRGSLREELVRIGKLPPSKYPTRISSTH